MATTTRTQSKSPSEQRPTLHRLIESARWKQIHELFRLEAGADAGERGPNGNTPLLYAAQEGHAEVVRALLRAGADPASENDVGATAAGLALGWGHREVAGVLGVTVLTDDADSSARSWLWAAGLLTTTAIGTALFKRYVGRQSGHARRQAA